MATSTSLVWADALFTAARPPIEPSGQLAFLQGQPDAATYSVELASDPRGLRVFMDPKAAAAYALSSGGASDASRADKVPGRPRQTLHALSVAEWVALARRKIAAGWVIIDG